MPLKADVGTFIWGIKLKRNFSAYLSACIGNIILNYEGHRSRYEILSSAKKLWEIKEFSEQGRSRFNLYNYCQTSNNYAASKILLHEVQQ